jgi:hypothetical protein
VLNCEANGRLLRKGIFDDIWVQPTLAPHWNCNVRLTPTASCTLEEPLLPEAELGGENKKLIKVASLFLLSTSSSTGI